MQSALRTSTARIARTSRTTALPRSAPRGQARFSSSDPAHDHSAKHPPAPARFNLAVVPLPIFVSAGIAAALAFSIHHLFKDKDLRIDHEHQSLIDKPDTALEKALKSDEKPVAKKEYKKGQEPQGIKAYAAGSSGSSADLGK